MHRISDSPIVAFSHLRWDFVYQRPQHVLSRLARQRPVYVIEEPEYAPDEAPSLVVTRPAPGVTVLRPRTPCAAPGFADDQMPYLRKLIRSFEGWPRVRSCILWMYTPMALPLQHLFEREALVYDCMDELSAFDFAPAQLIEREAQLLREADVVFTGGPSLFRAKKRRNPRVLCLPSSVDAAHFGRARTEMEEPGDQQGIPRPRLGFFGVIDERIDPALIDGVAAAHPDWHVVMVGPVAKIDAARLPRAENIHYLGRRSYAELPAYLSGWDVCLMPFALNRSTEFISPTKTLEYMAAERPIVSSPINDVVEPYGDIVYIGDGREAFVQACERALSDTESERARRTERMRIVLKATSWERTVTRMARAIDDVLLDATEVRAATPIQRAWPSA